MARTTKAQYCRQHSKEGMIDIYNRRCAQSECNKRPSYGVIGTGKMEYCAQHAREGMADVRSGKCAQTTCNVRASYGVAGTRKAEYCRRHANDGMVGVPKKRCTLKNCNEWASLAMAGSRMVYKCGRHLSNGTTNVFDEVSTLTILSSPRSLWIETWKACVREAQNGKMLVILSRARTKILLRKHESSQKMERYLIQTSTENLVREMKVRCRPMNRDFPSIDIRP